MPHGLFCLYICTASHILILKSEFLKRPTFVFLPWALTWISLMVLACFHSSGPGCSRLDNFHVFWGEAIFPPFFAGFVLDFFIGLLAVLPPFLFFFFFFFFFFLLKKIFRKRKFYLFKCMIEKHSAIHVLVYY